MKKSCFRVVANAADVPASDGHTEAGLRLARARGDVRRHCRAAGQARARGRLRANEGPSAASRTVRRDRTVLDRVLHDLAHGHSHRLV